MKEVKLVTINTWKCDGAYLQRLPVLAAQLSALKPDVVTCQECFASHEANTLAYLAAQLGMKYSFVPGRAKKRLLAGEWVESTSGLGVLSKYPIGPQQIYDLPAAGEDIDRKAQQVSIQIADGISLMITNTHLTHLGNPQGGRLKQAEALATIVNKASAQQYRIVCGDMNSEATSPEMQAFLKLTNSIDCYTAGNGPEPRYSLAEAYYKSNKQVCVDHIFALPILPGGHHPAFKDSAVVLNKADEATGVFASDHFGIATTLVIPNQQA